MNFGLTDDQTALRSAVRDVLDRYAGRDELRLRIETGGYDRTLWTRLAKELGLHGITVPQRYGGAGATEVELAVVLEEMGRRLLCAPYFATIALAATLLRESGDDDATQRWLPAIVNGELTATLAFAGSSTVIAEPDWRLAGTVESTVDGLGADVVFIAARAPDGLGIFAVEGSAPGLIRTPLPALDPTRPLARLDLTDAPATRLAVPDAAGLLQRVRDIAAVALAAEQVGVAQACLDMAVAYANTRVQFDRPIGSFQAVKHRCANMFVDVESARALVLNAAWALSSGAEDAAVAASTTRAYVNDACYRVAAANLQLHGGIGYTWEHDAQLYFKRATASRQLLGSTQDHRERVASLIGLGP